MTRGNVRTVCLKKKTLECLYLLWEARPMPPSISVSVSHSLCRCRKVEIPSKRSSLFEDTN